MWRFPFVSLLVASALAEDAPTKTRSSTPEQRLAFAKSAAEAYHFRLGKNQSSVARLSPEPLLRWNNKVVREDDGFLFLWTEGDKGRPVAAAQLFLVDAVWHHEFQSVCRDRFQAQSDLNLDRDWTWQPAGPGIEFVDANDLESPAASPAMRLRQMKSIADRFSAAVDMNEDFKTPEQLRLLTTPVYRYSSQDQSILDGAIFAFVQGTNPEILLVIEAEGQDESAKWKVGFARMSSFHLRALRDQDVVWKKSRAPVPTTDAASTFNFRLSIQQDGSADVKITEPLKSTN